MGHGTGRACVAVWVGERDWGGVCPTLWAPQWKGATEGTWLRGAWHGGGEITGGHKGDPHTFSILTMFIWAMGMPLGGMRTARVSWILSS